MDEQKKEHGFMDIIRQGLSYVSQVLSASLLPPIVEGTEMVMKKIEDRIIKIEKRIYRKILSFLVIGLGVLFFIFAIFFFLIDYLGWSRAAVFFLMGIILFGTGLMLKIFDSNK